MRTPKRLGRTKLGYLEGRGRREGGAPTRNPQRQELRSKRQIQTCIDSVCCLRLGSLLALLMSKQSVIWELRERIFRPPSEPSSCWQLRRCQRTKLVLMPRFSQLREGYS